MRGHERVAVGDARHRTDSPAERHAKVDAFVTEASPVRTKGRQSSGCRGERQRAHAVPDT